MSLFLSRFFENCFRFLFQIFFRFWWKIPWFLEFILINGISTVTIHVSQWLEIGTGAKFSYNCARQRHIQSTLPKMTISKTFYTSRRFKNHEKVTFIHDFEIFCHAKNLRVLIGLRFQMIISNILYNHLRDISPLQVPNSNISFFYVMYKRGCLVSIF